MLPVPATTEFPVIDITSHRVALLKKLELHHDIKWFARIARTRWQNLLSRRRALAVTR